jgi:tetratricopeptide (TPR) repeat protein
VATVTVCSDTGREQVARRLPIALAEYFDWRRRFDDKLLTATVSLNSARGAADRPAEAVALTIGGLALGDLRRFDEAVVAHRDAAAIYQEVGDRHGEGGALNNLGLALRVVRRFDEAIAAHRDAAAAFGEAGDRDAEHRALEFAQQAQSDQRGRGLRRAIRRRSAEAD